MTTLRQHIYALRAIETPSVHHPESNQLTHTIQVTLAALGRLGDIPGHLHRDFLLAALTHDIGKAVAVQRNGTTHGHEADSVALLEQAFAASTYLRMAFDAETVFFLVKQHIRIMHLNDMRPAKREALQNHPLFPVLTILRECDLAGRKPIGISLTMQYIFEAVLGTLGIP